MVLVLSGNLEYPQNKNMKVINKICNLSEIKKKLIECLIIDDCLIRDDGSISINDNIIYLDEIIIMKKVKNIIVNFNAKFENENSKRKIQSIGDYYNINVLFLK